MKAGGKVTLLSVKGILETKSEQGRRLQSTQSTVQSQDDCSSYTKRKARLGDFNFAEIKFLLSYNLDRIGGGKSHGIRIYHHPGIWLLDPAGPGLLTAPFWLQT